MESAPTGCGGNKVDVEGLRWWCKRADMESAPTGWLDVEKTVDRR